MNTEEGKYIMPCHLARQPPRETGCPVGTPGFLAYLGTAEDASAGFVPELGSHAADTTGEKHSSLPRPVIRRKTSSTLYHAIPTAVICF